MSALLLQGVGSSSGEVSLRVVEETPSENTGSITPQRLAYDFGATSAQPF